MYMWSTYSTTTRIAPAEGVRVPIQSTLSPPFATKKEMRADGWYGMGVGMTDQWCISGS